MPRAVTLSRRVSVVLDGSGNGTASLGPQIPGEVWNSGTVAVKASTNVKEAICRVYVGNALSDGSFLGGTTWGSTGDSTDFTGPLYPGQQIFAAWTGGDSGATATAVVTGIRQVP